MTEFLHPDDAGHWEGDVYVFTPPIVQVDETGRKLVMQRADFSLAVLPEGVTRDDVVHALLNPIIPIRQSGEG